MSGDTISLKGFSGGGGGGGGGESGKWSVSKAKPRVTCHFPDLPESSESNSIPVTRGISPYLFHYTKDPII